MYTVHQGPSITKNPKLGNDKHNQRWLLYHFKFKMAVPHWQASLLRTVVEGLGLIMIPHINQPLPRTLCLSASNHRREMSTEGDTWEVYEPG